MADARSIHADSTEFVGASHFEARPRGRDKTARLRRDLGEQFAHRNFREIERGRASFKARQIEQVVENAQQPVCIVARGLEQLTLRRCERTDVLLEQKINRETQARERSLELVADGAREICFSIIEQAKLGHILKNDRSALEGRERVADREDARQVIPHFAIHAEGDDVAIIRGQIMLARRHHLRERLGELRWKARGKIR